MKKKKMIMIPLLIATVIIITSYTYVKIKLHLTKNAVEEYLIKEKGIKKQAIEELHPVFDWIKSSGDRKWSVRVKIKGDNEYYGYYKDSKKIK
ncbi:plasmid partition family protein [Gottfriedia acidiceleris]|uniref:plasmid partition family protein n=1 Tax=Gottfriedia acidiceleris TaxID=371036 RepID=UPI003000A73F